jgi:hypothetical protein
MVPGARAYFTLRNISGVLGLFFLIATYHFVFRLQPILTDRDDAAASLLTAPLGGETIYKVAAAAANAVSCVGPRGMRIAESSDDQIKTRRLRGSFLLSRKPPLM